MCGGASASVLQMEKGILTLGCKTVWQASTVKSIIDPVEFDAIQAEMRSSEEGACGISNPYIQNSTMQSTLYVLRHHSGGRYQFAFNPNVRLPSVFFHHASRSVIIFLSIRAL